jgi:hypothetical protein
MGRRSFLAPVRIQRRGCVDYNELLGVLRSWVGCTVTVLSQPTEGEPGAERMTGTLIEGYPEATTRYRREEERGYAPTDSYALFTITRNEVRGSRFPVGITHPIYRDRTTARWDSGREGTALWISIARGHTSLWTVERYD